MYSTPTKPCWGTGPGMGSEAEAARLSGPSQQEPGIPRASPAPYGTGHPPGSAGTCKGHACPHSPQHRTRGKAAAGMQTLPPPARLSHGSSCQGCSSQSSRGAAAAGGDPPSGGIRPLLQEGGSCRWQRLLLPSAESLVCCSSNHQAWQVHTEDTKRRWYRCSISHAMYSLKEFCSICTFATFHKLLLRITCFLYYEYSYRCVPSVRKQSIALLFRHAQAERPLQDTVVSAGSISAHANAAASAASTWLRRCCCHPCTTCKGKWVGSFLAAWGNVGK